MKRVAETLAVAFTVWLLLGMMVVVSVMVGRWLW